MVTLFTLWLIAAPPDVSYSQATDTLDAALSRINTEGVSAADSVRDLESALRAVALHPEAVAGDATVLERMAEARLSVVWLHSNAGDQAAAEAAMDEAIRSARGHSLPAGKFGPSVLRLYEDRKQALAEAGTAVIDVDCGAIDCQLLIDERRSALPSDPLFLGGYRVWIGPREGNTDWESSEVELTEAGTTVRLVYQAGLATAPMPEPLTDAIQPQIPIAVDTNVSERKRVLPRWASILGMTVGAGLVVGGGLMLLDGNCTNTAQMTGDVVSPDAAPCDNVWVRKVPVGVAYGLMGGGAGLFGVFGAMLTVDEVRVGSTKHRQAMLTWGLRF